MADDPREQVQPETETQDSATPTETQQTAEQTSQGEVAPQAEQGGQDKSERVTKHNREYIDKLQEQLRVERQQRQYFENVFASLQPKQEAKPALSPLYDQETGQFNEQALTQRDQAILEAQQRAARAEQAVQSYLQSQEEREMFSGHPDLDPARPEFNEDFSHQVAAIKLHSMVNPEVYGKQLSGKEAADYLRSKSMNPKTVEKAKQEAAQQAVQQLSQKEQASLEATGTPQRRTEVTQDLDTLRTGTRKGNLDSIVARLRGV